MPIDNRFVAGNLLGGYRVVVDKHAETLTWIQPTEDQWRFIEMILPVVRMKRPKAGVPPTPEQIAWGKEQGWGRYSNRPGVFQVGGTLIVRPEVLEQMKKQILESPNGARPCT